MTKTRETIEPEGDLLVYERTAPSWVFAPSDDITPGEIAELLALLNITITGDVFLNRVSLGLSRHFKRFRTLVDAEPTCEICGNGARSEYIYEFHGHKICTSLRCATKAQKIWGTL